MIGRFISVDPLFVERPEECGVQECNLYSYSVNNPVVYIDPEGEAALFGALLGMALDVGVQVAMISMGNQENFSVGSVIISGGTGLVGAGIATKLMKIGKLGKLAYASKAADIAVDASLSAFGTWAKGGEVTVGGVAMDVAVGQAGGAFSKVMKTHDPQKLTSLIRKAKKQANTHKKISDKSRKKRQNSSSAAERKRKEYKKQSDAKATKAGMVASNAAKAMKDIASEQLEDK